MTSAIYRAQDVATIRSTLESEPIDDIQGRPSCYTLIKLLSQLCEAAKQVECEYSNYGMMWKVLRDEPYLIITGENVVAPLRPGLVPPYLPNGTSAQNATIQVTWQKNKELADQADNMDKALIEIAKSKLDPKFRTSLSTMFRGLPERTFVDFFDRIYRKWGRWTPHDVTENDERMRAPWDPSENDIADVIKQINDAVIFAYFVDHQKNTKEMVTVGEKLILDTGLFATQYTQWKQRPEAEQTWADFEDFWTTALDLWHTTSRTARQQGYAGNINQDNADEAEQAYLSSLQNFGEVNRDNAASFQALTATNAQMAHQLAASVQTMQQQLEQLALAVNTRPPVIVPPPPGYAPTQQASNPPQYMPTYQIPPQQHYQQQPQGSYRPSGRGGRGGRGGGGRGGGRGPSQGRGNYPMQQQQYGQNQGYYQQAQQQGTYGRAQKPAFSNPVKFHKNWNYCHSCGYDVEDWHTSPTCPNPKPGHIPYATRENPCNGCKKGMHKDRF
jgi:hypothetical protein